MRRKKNEKIYDSHRGAEFVSDLRKVDHETVSNESKEKSKAKKYKKNSPVFHRVHLA